MNLPTNPRELMDTSTTFVAVGAVGTPAWLPWLQQASEMAAILAPIFGLVWLLVQIWAKIVTTKNKDNE